DVDDAAAHAGREVAAGGAEDHDAAAGHVFATMVANAFDDRQRAAVADAEPFGRSAAEERLATGRAVQGDVADDDVILGHVAGLGRRIDDHAAAGEAFADVVVGVAFELERDALGEKRAETLPGRAEELEVDRVVRQQFFAEALGDFVAEDRAHRAIGVDDTQL